MLVFISRIFGSRLYCSETFLKNALIHVFQELHIVFLVCDTQFVYVLEFVLLIAMMFIVCIGCVAYSFLGSLCLVSKFNFCAEVTNNIILLHYLVYMSAIIFEIFAVQILSNANIGVCLEIFFHLGLFVVTYYKNLSRKLKLDGKHGNC